MTKRDLEKALKNGLILLVELLPSKAYLYGPLLYGTAMWAVRRPSAWREQIFAWQTWPQPGAIMVKPDEFILYFFRSHEGLAGAYKRDIERKNMAALKRDFGRLYPVMGLRDPFLEALFHREIEGGDFAALAREFDGRLARARKDIAALPRRRLFRILGGFAEDVLDLGMTLLDETKVRSTLAALLRNKLGEGE
jgi:hypothetical protein